jgi:ankyrin repeat protein/CRP-like cAMP-binding protein
MTMESRDSMDYNVEETEGDIRIAPSFDYSKIDPLQNRRTASVSGFSTTSARRLVRESYVRWIVFPWNKSYRVWWSLTVICAIATIFTETFQISFAPAGLAPFDDFSSIVEYFLTGIFGVDIVVNFFLAYFDTNEDIVFDRKLIAQHYLRFLFWIDFIGVFPFYLVALACAGLVGQDTTTTQYLALLRLLKLVRLHRVKQLFDLLQYNARVSLTWLTVMRNFAAALIWSHFSACVLFFIAREYGFDPDRTWIGDKVLSLDTFELYVTSLYWAIVTFTTVGYGDYSPTNSAEQIWSIIYMLLNIIISSWIIGSMTLLIVKQDERTSFYRDSMQILKQYAAMHNFDRAMHKSLKTQLKLEFKYQEIGDEQVLKQFPSAVRRKVLRRLYLPSLLQTRLMKDTRQQYIDAFLTACTVEIFSPGEEILQRGSICSDLYLLVEGVVTLQSSGGRKTGLRDIAGDDSTRLNGGVRDVCAGEFINEIGFFTDSPQVETVCTKTVCKTLTMSKASYKVITEDHPGSASKILQNLLTKMEALATENGSSPSVALPTKMQLLRAGSVYDDSEDTSYHTDVNRAVAEIQRSTALTAVQDLIKMHINKQNDDHTTSFLFAAARGDTSVIALMCDQGFDPNSADYDHRTALMVASMKGNTDAVRLILDFQANPNLVDMHGTSALYEAARKGHEDTMEELMNHGAKLCMDEPRAASILCQTVSDGDILTLRRLLRAGIPVNAADYDQRTAAHIAAAEGHVAALKVLVEFGADLTLEDRWHNTVSIEAKKSNTRQVLEYLDSPSPIAD